MGYDILMALNFPNSSRSYDARGHRVRFWGYDEVLEIPFFVEEGALSRIYPQARGDEAGFLNAFDANRDLIIKVAGKLYSRRRIGSYTLAVSDF